LCYNNWLDSECVVVDLFSIHSLVCFVDTTAYKPLIWTCWIYRLHFLISFFLQNLVISHLYSRIHWEMDGEWTVLKWSDRDPIDLWRLELKILSSGSLRISIANSNFEINWKSRSFVLLKKWLIWWKIIANHVFRMCGKIMCGRCAGRNVWQRAPRVAV
jgi:hypothetical protein